MRDCQFGVSPVNYSDSVWSGIGLVWGSKLVVCDAIGLVWSGYWVVCVVLGWFWVVSWWIGVVWGCLHGPNYSCGLFKRDRILLLFLDTPTIGYYYCPRAVT